MPRIGSSDSLDNFDIEVMENLLVQKIHNRLFIVHNIDMHKACTQARRREGIVREGGLYRSEVFSQEFPGPNRLPFPRTGKWLAVTKFKLVSAFIFPSQWALCYTHITFLFVLSKWCHLHILLPHLFSVELMHGKFKSGNFTIKSFWINKMTLRRTRSIWKYITLNWINT